MSETPSDLLQLLENLPPASHSLACAWLTRLAANASQAAGPWAQSLGLRFTYLQDGVCRAELTLGKEFHNALGIAHGSIAYALADFTMGGAVFSMVGLERRPVTIEIKMTYHRAVQEGTLFGEGCVIHLGQRIAYLEASVTDQAGERVASASGTFFINQLATAEHT